MCPSVSSRVRIDLPCALIRVLILSWTGISLVAADLTNRWSFNQAAGNASAGTVLIDSISNATATVQGNGSNFTGAALTITGATTGNRSKGFISGYVDLPNGLISSKTDLTVEVWATPVSARANARLFDFGRVASAGFGGGAAGEIIDVLGTGQTPGTTAGSDSLVLNFCVGNTLASQRLEARLDGANIVTVPSTLPTTAGTQFHYVMTFEDGVGTYGASGGRMTWYRNGTQVGTGDVAFRLSSLEDVNNWLGRSQWSDDNNANATYNELRIYDHALTSPEIAANLAAGPEVIAAPPVPAPTPTYLWTFNNQASSGVSPGMTFTDSLGGMVATLKGNGGVLTGTALNLPGNTTGNQSAAAISAYLDLPNGIISAQPGISVEAWATPLSSKNWQRLFDFGRTGTTVGTDAVPGEINEGTANPGTFAGYDNLSLTLNTAGVLGSYQLEGQINNSPPVYSSTTAATTAGTQYHFVLVVEDGAGTFGSSGCQARWYRNGVLQNSLSLAFRLTSISDVNNWIGRSQYAGDSNSNLSLNELRFYNRPISPGEIVASYTAGPDPTSGPPEPPVPARDPLNRWSFNQPAGSVSSGTPFTDSASGTVATLRGNGATLSGTALVLPGTTNGNQTAAAISAYLDLPNGTISSKPNLTFEAWATPLSSKTWQRLFDFGRGTLTSAGAATGEIIDGTTAPGAFTAYDNLLLSLNNNGVLGSHRLEGRYNGGATITSDTDLSSITTAGTECHYVLTVKDGAGAYGSSGCQAKWYRNGAVQGSVDLNYRLTQVADVNNWIGRSMWAADMNAHVSINELRIYDRALTPREVTATLSAGANVVYPPPVASHDTATIHAGQKVRIKVLDNDTGLLNRGSLEIVTPPTIGTASVDSSGEILYAHSGNGISPVTFTYQVSGEGGISTPATVSINIASALRITNPSLAMPAAPPVNAWQLIDALPGLTFVEPLCIASIPGNTSRLFVCERMAKIKHVPDVTATAPTQNVFLNLQSAIAGRTPAETIEGGGNNEHGLLGLAFHPNYATNGCFYVAYTVRISAGSYYQRISRFKVSATDPSLADPTSELVLLQQLDEGANHDGGDLHFGPSDGYLYYTAGDEENPKDFRLNSQKINKDFFGGIFRIDVDKKAGNLEPNSHPAILTDNGVARFSVPLDNPFVHTTVGGAWNGTYNGITVTPLTGVRSEFWATGLRHVWRMSFDPSTGDLWGGDVGQDTYEEVNRITKGGNYGWVYREGKHDTAFTNPVPPAKPAGFTSIDPVYEYVHAAIAGDTLYKGNSVVGGYVYRGTRFPSLVGTYVFSDSVSGHVWQMDTSTGAVNRLTGLPGAYGVFSTQGVDPSNKDLLFAAYLNGKIMRLTTATSSAEGFPATLAATRLFSDLADLSPSPGLLPYQPNVSFWSDHAIKRRWFTIPDAGTTMTWSNEGNWIYPTGTVWVKHFDLELTRGNPATKKRIETRVLVKTDAGSYGVSYRWNEAQTDAALVADTGEEFDITIDDNGTPHTQRWQIPGRTSCLTCHTPQAGHALSFNTPQLNLHNTIHGFTGNQLELLTNGGFLNNTPDPVGTLPRHVRPDETQYPLEQRARSYFAVNCAYCHQAGGSVGGFWDGRAHLTLEQTGLINGVAVNSGGSPLNRYIVPGDPAHSVILGRMAASNGFSRMPPLGTTETDPANIQLITDWINNSLPNRPIYQQWRDGFFAALDPEGAKSADPDGDGVSNYDEYLRGSSPLSGSGAWQAEIAGGALRFLRKSHRYYSIQTSDGLDQWQSWPIPEIENSYKATDELIEIPLPVDPDGKQFFRFNVSEP